MGFTTRTDDLTKKLKEELKVCEDTISEMMNEADNRCYGDCYDEKLEEAWLYMKKLRRYFT